MSHNIKKKIMEDRIKKGLEKLSFDIMEVKDAKELQERFNAYDLSSYKEQRIIALLESDYKSKVKLEQVMTWNFELLQNPPEDYKRIIKNELFKMLEE